MAASLLQLYRGMVETGEIGADPAQALAVEKLQLLGNRLASYTPPAKTDFFSFFTRRRGEVPRGLYIFGGVGRGKTMLMDLFFETVPFKAKRRVHFHEFMAEVHERIATVRKSNNGDAITAVAADIAAETGLLCFDELFVTNIADAMILGRLFENLFDRGLVMIATSNVPPSELYKDGLNRELFLPFVHLVEEKMELLELEAVKDYRLDKLKGAPLYFSPLGETARARIEEVWQRLAGRHEATPQVLKVKGREVHVPLAAMGTARFDFADLFEKPLGAEDYLAIARAYHTVIVENIPALRPERRNEARRFITFVDALYDHRTGLIVSAEAEPEALYPEGDGADHFQRTASRLMEMRSPEYLANHRHIPQPSAHPHEGG